MLQNKTNRKLKLIKSINFQFITKILLSLVIVSLRYCVRYLRVRSSKGHVTLATKSYNIVVQQCCTTMLYNKFCLIKHFVKTQNMLCKQISKTQNMLAKYKTCLDNNVVQYKGKQYMFCKLHCTWYSTIQKNIADSVSVYETMHMELVNRQYCTLVVLIEIFRYSIHYLRYEYIIILQRYKSYHGVRYW